MNLSLSLSLSLFHTLSCVSATGTHFDGHDSVRVLPNGDRWVTPPGGSSGYLVEEPRVDPDTTECRIRVGSWNILCDFFDNKDFPHHMWAVRRPHVLQAIAHYDFDVIGLQEMSPEQVAEMARVPGYDVYTVTQHPADLPAGLIAKNEEVEAWKGKFMGTPPACIMVKRDVFECLEQGRFWLNPEPNELPKYSDRGTTDKGFGNMNTYRNVLWLKLRHISSGKIVFFFNSHYPLAGNDATRYSCAAVERAQIREIAGDHFWISTGDRNPVGGAHGEAQAAIIAPLFQDAYSAVDPAHHEGPLCSWAGFLSDKFKNPIDENGQFVRRRDVLDWVFSSQPADRSAYVLPVFDPETGSVEYNPAVLEESRNWASDHLMVVADYTL